MVECGREKRNLACFLYLIQIFAQTRVGFDSLFSHHSRRIVGLSRHSRSAEISFSCHSLPWLMEWLRMKNDGRIWGCLSKIGGSSAAAGSPPLVRRRTLHGAAGMCAASPAVSNGSGISLSSMALMDCPLMIINLKPSS